MTALVSILAILLLVPSGVLAGVVAHQSVTNTVWLEARQEATLVAAADRLHHVTGTIKSEVPGIDLVQIVSPDHHVLASSAAARGLPPLSKAWPEPQDPQEDVQSCTQGKIGCVRLSALRETGAANSPVVYAGRRAPAESATGLINVIFVIQGVALIMLAVATTWKVTGRTLRPVEGIRAELAAINVNDLRTRVPEPACDDEIARLARTINSTLERLEHAKGRMERALNQQRQFAADASHELRTPVAGLRAQLEEAQLHPAETDLEELLAHSLRDVDRLQSIITDLLLLERVGTGTATTSGKVDLAAVVRAEVSRRPDPGAVRLRLVPDVNTEANQNQIGRVVNNLLDNAERHARHSVSVEVRHNGREAELVVDDDGDGIAVADRERIFERFTRLDAARSRGRGGTGLGLAIARDIVHAHGGTIEVGTSPIGGARFVVRLPLAESSVPGRHATHSSA
ncbi:HAMP domain-containing sensor histidine kinase [Sphaerisporangium sp. NPDC088356]|uniref:sensor histidine kinase n=1 Tax=Sphaerisporangium sp. NPDC088356 TaxID=3154871 RepID=UPI003428F140